MCKLNWNVYHMQIMEGDLCRRLLRAGIKGLRANRRQPGRQEPGTGEIAYWRVYKN